MAFGKTVKERGIRKGLGGKVPPKSPEDFDGRKPILALAGLRALAGLVRTIRSRLHDRDAAERGPEGRRDRACDGTDDPTGRAFGTDRCEDPSRRGA